jgi:hypothetical protein
LIIPIVRTAMVALRRDPVSLVLSFVVPIAFFSIFAVVFGGQHDTVPRSTSLWSMKTRATLAAARQRP